MPLPMILFMSSFSTNGKSILHVLLLIGTYVTESLEQSFTSIELFRCQPMIRNEFLQNSQNMLQCLDWQPLKIFFQIIIHLQIILKSNNLTDSSDSIDVNSLPFCFRFPFFFFLRQNITATQLSSCPISSSPLTTQM